LTLFYAAVTALRRLAYWRGWRARTRLSVPVIVVGNLTVGGSGKTPLVIWLVETLRAAGYQPGVISRGYGGSARAARPVRADSTAAAVGDEPLLIARRCVCPVWVGRRRAEAGRALLDFHPEVDVLVSDDGLQHYGLQRDLEIVVVDGARGFGNGHLLPIGPLREPLRRLAAVDAVVLNGTASPGLRETIGAAALVPVFTMQLDGRIFTSLADPTRQRDAAEFASQPLSAIAGIGHPQRFFDHLARLGVQADARAFPDHHAYRASDLPPGTVLMTEKDAVKCAAFAPVDAWALRIDARPDEGLKTHILERLKARHGQ